MPKKKKKVTGISGANRGTDEESDFIHPTKYCITLFIYRWSRMCKIIFYVINLITWVENSISFCTSPFLL